MKQIAAFIFTFSFALLVGQSAMAEKRVALVIGNSAYKHVGALRNPVNDAKDVAGALRVLGFSVILKQNLDIDGFDDAISSFSGRLSGADVALFWYAGHGLQYKKDSYLMPVDTRLKNELSIRRKTVAVADIISQMESEAKTSLLFLDACRNNPLADALGRRLTARGRSGRMSRGLGRMPSTTGDTLIVYAAAPGTIADDGRTRNSPFAKAVMRHMKVAGLEIGALLKRVRRDVKRDTSGKQKPEWLSRLESEFRFKKSNNGKGQKFDARSLDLAFWQDIRGSKDVADYEDYLQQYPKGTFARRARRLKKKYEKKVAVGVFPTQRPVERNRFTSGTIFDDCNGAGWCPSMVVVPKGSFMMGSKKGDKDEKHVRRVTFGKPFAVGRFEVSFKEWDACVSEKGCSHKPKDVWGRGKQPVMRVSWNDIKKQYLPWLSRKTGKSYRLLSEAEWEYVARAGTTGPFSWSGKISTAKANYDSNHTYGGSSKGKYREKTVPVDSFEANAFGLYNVHGNVWEWVEDCYKDSYKGAPTDGSARTAGKCGLRVLRGGSWYSYPSDLRSANRYGSRPDNRYNGFGFRVARSLPLPRTR